MEFTDGPNKKQKILPLTFCQRKDFLRFTQMVGISGIKR